jgi:hypothetical protein
MNEPGSTTSDGQSIRTTTSGGRWLLKNAMACSGCEKTALKNPSCVCAAGMGEFPGVSTARRINELRDRRKDALAARSLGATILRSSLHVSSRPKRGH